MTSLDASTLRLHHEAMVGRLIGSASGAQRHPKRARWHLHFTPISASSLNVIEGSFSLLTCKALTNTSFTSTRQLEAAIDVWGSHWNADPQPIVWTKTVDDIITKVKRGRATLDRVTESATHH